MINKISKDPKLFETYDIMFFDIPYDNLLRFGSEISKRIKLIDEEIKTIGVFCNRIPKSFEGSHLDTIILREDIANIDEFLLTRKIKLLVLTNPRIPDQEMMLHAKKNGVKVVMLQEGIIFSGTNINDVNVSNFLSVFGKLKKTFSYLDIVRKMCEYDDKPFLPLIKNILRIRKNITLIVASYFSEKLNANYIYTMGEYWHDYYISEIGYNRNQLVLIGDHDLDNFVEPKEVEDSMCYIANVLVEDGTIKKSVFLKFIQIFSESVSKDKRIYIKLHPRSDIQLYKAFENHNVVFLRKEPLPNVKIYVGHRSTLIGRALYISDHLILWRFKSEKICFYEPFASKVCMNKNDFLQAIDEVSAAPFATTKKDKVSKYYLWNKNGALNSCAHHIVNYYSKDNI